MNGGVIGLIGGLSWESTATYYKYFNTLVTKSEDPYQQPQILIDSLDFSKIVPLQQQGNWEQAGEVLVRSAQTLEDAGAQVIGIAANTMHLNYEQVSAAVQTPVIDIRKAIAQAAQNLGYSSIGLLGTKYVVQESFYAAEIEKSGISVIKPSLADTEELQRIIFEELTLGIIKEESRNSLRNISQRCIDQGAEAIGLCCTEFGLLFNSTELFPILDSTVEHVRALLTSAGYRLE